MKLRLGVLLSIWMLVFSAIGQGSELPNVMIVLVDDMDTLTWGVTAAKLKHRILTDWPQAVFAIRSFTTREDVGPRGPRS